VGWGQGGPTPSCGGCLLVALRKQPHVPEGRRPPPPVAPQALSEPLPGVTRRAGYATDLDVVTGVVDAVDDVRSEPRVTHALGSPIVPGTNRPSGSL
jgi:hypothetical protein